MIGCTTAECTAGPFPELGLTCPCHLALHSLLKLPRAHAYKGHLVPVPRVQVGLQLEDKAREALVDWVDGRAVPVPHLPRPGRQADEGLEEQLHAKVGDGGPEEQGRQLAAADLKGRGGARE